MCIKSSIFGDVEAYAKSLLVPLANFICINILFIGKGKKVLCHKIGV